ncbi:MAG: hypothetical protein JSS45_06565 [Proteobacteria bacterium]|nr:hypothetical protein [Pseudomonadota bacterium]
MKKKDEADRLLAAMLEGSRQDAGRFDGLRGNVGDNASPLLADMVRYLRACLLAHYPEAEARALLAEFSPPAAPGFRAATSVPDDVRMALTLLNMIASAFRCEPDQLESLLLGARDRKRQKGTKTGGTEAGKGRTAAAMDRHRQWANDYDALIADGRNKRDIAAVLASRHRVNESTIRRALKKARVN